MDRLTKNVPAVNFKAVPVNIALDFVFELDDDTWLGLQSIFDRLSDYEDTGLTPEQIKTMKADLQWAINYLREGGGCAGCKHEEKQETAEPCSRCQRITLQGDDLWEFHGAEDTNVPSKTATDTNVGDKEV